MKPRHRLGDSGRFRRLAGAQRDHCLAQGLPVSAVKFWRGERNGPRATEGTTEMPCSVSGMGLAFAAEVAQNFLMEPGAERSVIAKVLNG